MDVDANPPLLEALDALVRAQPGPMGLSGSVCFGVRGAERARWWRASFDARGGSTAFFDQLPAEVDVAVGLDPEEAAAILRGAIDEPPGEGLRLVAGDRALLARFVERYVARRSMLDLRVSTGKQST
ncbi:MAG: hypothetical protein U1E65_17165 [Myxococcota bacterium]